MTHLDQFLQELSEWLQQANDRHGYTITAKITTMQGVENNQPYIKHVPVIVPLKTHEVIDNASNSDLG